MKNNNASWVRIRLVKDNDIPGSQECTSPEKVYDFIGEEMSELDREHVCIISLNSKGKAVNAIYASVGDISTSIVSPREIFKAAILSNATSIVMLHNHPSGDPTPSVGDYEVTDSVKSAGKILGIELMDHIIVGDHRFYSFAKEGWPQINLDKLSSVINDPAQITWEQMPARRR